MTEQIEEVQVNSLNELESDDVTVWMLTTVDNPFNPHTQYNEWYAHDVLNGYFTSNYLARIANLSDDLSDSDERLAINAAIDEILKHNVLGIYIKVTKEDFRDRTK